MALERYDLLDHAARDEALERQARRDAWAMRLRIMSGIALSTVAGLALMGFALHTTSPSIGGIAWLAGQLVWLGGWLVTLLWGWVGSERRGAG